MAAGAIATQLAQQQEQERMRKEREENEKLAKEQQVGIGVFVVQQNLCGLGTQNYGEL